jgi:hypothetical protein
MDPFGLSRTTETSMRTARTLLTSPSFQSPTSSRQRKYGAVREELVLKAHRFLYHLIVVSLFSN